MEFYDDHAADRDRFEILAFHDASAKTFAELDPKMAPLIEKAWGGRALPFPILLDATGRTVDSYGIRSFPTVILVDPEGRLVKGGDEEFLGERLFEGRPAVRDLIRKFSEPKGGKREALAALKGIPAEASAEQVAAISIFLQGCQEADLAEAALDALGRQRGEKVVAGISGKGGLSHPDPRRQEKAARVLGKMGGDFAKGALFAGLGQEGTTAAGARAIAEGIHALCRNDPDAARTILESTASPNPAVRAATAELAGRMPAPRALERLVSMLRADDSEEARIGAAAGLGWLGDRAALPALKQAAAKDPSRAVQKAALQATARVNAKK